MNYFIILCMIFAYEFRHLGAMDESIDSNISAEMHRLDLSESSSNKRRRALSDHEINQKHIDNINNRLNQNLVSNSNNVLMTPPRHKRKIEDLQTPDITYINSMNNRDVSYIDRQLKFMTETPEKLQQRVITSLANKNFSLARKLFPGEDENTVLNNTYGSPTHTTNVVSNNAHLLPSPDKRQATAVSVHHFMEPIESYGVHGELTNISGGHNIKRYIDKKLINPFDDVFVGSDGVMGVNVQGVVSKTIHDGLTSEQLVLNVKQAKTVAENVDRFKISELPLGGFIGSYHASGNPLALKTQFPIVAITDKNKTDNIYVGRFGKFNLVTGKPLV